MSQINFQTITAPTQFELIEVKDGLLSVVDSLLENEAISTEDKFALANIRAKIATTLTN